jgi:hypothetical protein
MDYKDIAQLLEIPQGTVMSRLFYARKKLAGNNEEYDMTERFFICLKSFYRGIFQQQKKKNWKKFY